jgi:hypothetical protein
MVIDFDFGAIIGNHPMTDGLRMVGVVFLLLFHIQLKRLGHTAFHGTWPDA